MYLFGLVGLIIGLILGIFFIQIKTHKKQQKNTIQNDLLIKKIKILNKQQEELENYFQENITLLNTIINNCQKLYQIMIKSSNTLRISQNENNNEKNLSHKTNYCNNFTNDASLINNDHLLTKEPRDYPENNNHFK